MAEILSFLRDIKQCDRCRDLTEEGLLSDHGVVRSYKTKKEVYDGARSDHYHEPCLICRVISERDTRPHWVTSALQVRMHVHTLVEHGQHSARLKFDMQDDSGQVIEQGEYGKRELAITGVGNESRSSQLSVVGFPIKPSQIIRLLLAAFQYCSI
jgi:hypothetical protein